MTTPDPTPPPLADPTARAQYGHYNEGVPPPSAAAQQNAVVTAAHRQLATDIVNQAFFSAGAAHTYLGGQMAVDAVAPLLANSEAAAVAEATGDWARNLRDRTVERDEAVAQLTEARAALADQTAKAKEGWMRQDHLSTQLAESQAALAETFVTSNRTIANLEQALTSANQRADQEQIAATTYAKKIFQQEQQLTTAHVELARVSEERDALKKSELDGEKLWRNACDDRDTLREQVTTLTKAMQHHSDSADGCSDVAATLREQVRVLREALEHLDLRFMANNENIRTSALSAISQNIISLISEPPTAAQTKEGV